MKIGDEIWCHDYRSHRNPWFKGTITGETRQSWLVGQYKINKKTMLENQGQWGNRRWCKEDEMRNEVWLGKHRHRIGRHVEQCKDIELLRRVADLIGYDPNNLPS